MSGERKAGPELDTEVAEKIFGEVEAHAPCGDGLSRTGFVSGTSLADCDAALRHKYRHEIAKGLAFWPAEYCGPNYSEDIAAAFLVVEKMRADGWRFSLDDSGADGQTWEAWFYRDWNGESWAITVCEKAASMEHAICLAALAALQAVAALPEGQPRG